MSVINFEGYWTGTLTGTNQGGFSLDVKQVDDSVSGIAKIQEPRLGQYEYTLEGKASDILTATLKPGRKSSQDFILGNVRVIASIDKDGNLSGRWESEIGTEGALTASRLETKPLKRELPKPNSVFLVHGHDDAAKHNVARFLEQLGVKPVILHEQVNRGMTVIEKFEEFSARAGFAIVLLTPDDFGHAKGKEEEKKPRARQNVILELGYFVGKLGRGKTFVIIRDTIEMPSDLFGLVHEQMDSSEGWKMKLARELKAAGFDVDMNKAIQ